MLRMKTNASAALCFCLILTLSGALRAQAQATQAGLKSTNAPSVPAALPGDDSPLPSLDSQLHEPGGLPAGTPPQTRKVIATPSLPLVLAVEAANTAVDACLNDGYPVSVAVTDEKGQLLVDLVADGVIPGAHGGQHAYVAIRKAITAAAFKMPTSALRPKILADPALLAQIKPNMSLWIGGVPIMAGDRVVGAMGASGAFGNEDENCVRIGIEKIQARLK